MSIQAHKLLSLSVNLAQYKSKDLIIKVFVENLNNIFEPYKFEWLDERVENRSGYLPINSSTQQYGFIHFSDVINDESIELLKDATKMLAVLLEKLGQEQLLNNHYEQHNLRDEKQTKQITQRQIDLQKRIDEFEALNEELNERNEELLLAKQSIEESEKQYSFLVQSANELIEITSIKEIYVYTARKINQLLNGHSIVSIVEFNYTENRWKMMHIEGIGNKIAKATKLLGFDLRQAEGDLSSKYNEEISRGNLFEIEFDLPDFFNYRISKAISAVIKKVFSIKKLYCITFRLNSQIAGNITIITNPKTAPVNTELIEAFVNQVSIFLQKQKIELALRESADFLAKSQEIAQLGSWKLDLIANQLTWSDEVYRILGCQPQEFTATYGGFLEFIHPQDRDLVDQAYRKSITEGEEKYEIEHRIIRKNTGEVRIVLEQCEHQRDTSGKIILSLGMIQDITERKKAEMDLVKRESLLDKIFNVLPIGLWFTDEKGKLLKGNPAGVKIWGAEPTVSPEEYGVFKARRLPSRKEIAPHDWALAHTIKEGKTITDELIEIDAFDGKKRAILNYTAPVFDNEGNMLGAIVVNNDITDLHTAQENLKANEQLLQTISDNMFDLVALTDMEGNYTFTGASHKILGYKTHELIGTNVMNYVHPDDLPMVMAAFKEFVSNGEETRKVDYRNRCADGSYLWFETIGRFICDKKGKPQKILFNSRDITERRKADEALRESEERFKNMFERHSAIMLLIDPNTGLIVDANQAACSFYGFSKQKLLSMKIEEINTLSPEQIKKERNQALLQQRNYFIFPHKLANGDIRTVEVHSSPITIQHSEILFSIIHDITERRKTEDELRKISQAVEQSPASVVITNLEGTIEYVNPKFSEITGYTFDEAIGQNPRVLKSGKQDEQFYSELWKTISSGKEWQGEFHNKKKNGEFFWESASISPIVDEEGKATHYIAIKEDITYRKQAEEAQQHLQIARQTIRFKQNFLANMSHEIRTPLTGVLGMIEILEHTQLDMQQKDFIHTLKTSGENLKEIIDQVLDFSKIEAGKISINPVTFQFTSLTGDARSLYRNNRKKGVKLLTDTDPKIPPYIKADKYRLTQILNNLVSNALKFTHAGSVEIRSQLESSQPENHKIVIRIEVKDTGIGIPESMQGQLFTPFTQVDDADTRSYEGTGLGLSICKQLVEIMGGKIGAISEQGKGSTFWFTFPAMAAEVPTSALKDNNSGTPKRRIGILLAEDKVVNQKVISLMISSMGHNIHIACNGQKALEMFEPGKFDLILMDIQMPVMDGVTATQKLKEKYDNLPPIVGLSANAFEGDREKYMALGMDEYITKPVKKEDFEELIRKLIK
jgi:PAS domain S-box-containing protein